MKEPVKVKSYADEHTEFCEAEGRELISAKLRAKFLGGLFGDEGKFEVGCCVNRGSGGKMKGNGNAVKKEE